MEDSTEPWQVRHTWALADTGRPSPGIDGADVAADEQIIAFEEISGFEKQHIESYKMRSRTSENPSMLKTRAVACQRMIVVMLFILLAG